MNFISTYTINLNDLKMIDSDCVKANDWVDLICENEGDFSREGEFMSFDMNGVELVIFYDLRVSGKIDYDPGDYYTPPYSDVEITYESIDVTEVTLDEYDIELTKELRKMFVEVVKNNL